VSSPDIRIAFGERLRKLRKGRGWTQDQMADILGLDRSYLADVERGKRNISILNLKVIADGFEISMSQMFSRL
jgi:transcriptional regulator with XRE-family HTH domain